jgi:hypothetical protein
VARNWDYQSGDDLNVIRDPKTGALVDRPFPDYDSVINTYNPNYTWQQNRSLQLLYTKAFAGRWGVNANYSYIVSSTIRTRWNDTRDHAAVLRHLARRRVVAADLAAPSRALLRLREDARRRDAVAVLQLQPGRALERDDRRFPLNQTAPRVILSNGRSVADPFFNVALSAGA